MSELREPASAPDPVLIWQWLRQQEINFQIPNENQIDVMDRRRCDCLLIVWRANGGVDIVLRPRMRVDKRLLLLDNVMTVLADPIGWDWKTGGDQDGEDHAVHVLFIGRLERRASVTPQDVWAVDGGTFL